MNVNPSNLAMRLLLILGCLAFVSACGEGGRVSGGVKLPSDFLGDPDGSVVVDLDAVVQDDVEVLDDAGDAVGLDDADVVNSDDADVIDDDADVEDLDAPDDAEDVEDVPCSPGEPGCPIPCETLADCLPYDDGDRCNGSLGCVDGLCTDDGAVVSCDSDTGNPCTVSVCDPASGECAALPVAEGTSCDDGDECTPGDRCESGACVGGPRLECDDRNPCTTDACAAGVCVFTNNTATCDDGNVCTLSDKCSGGLCLGSNNVCEDCDSDADCEPYDDGNPCNGTVTCSNQGECKVKVSSLVFCEKPSGTSCSVPVCNPSSGVCESENLGNGAGCDDGDPCTVNDMCAVGMCVGNPIDCADGECETSSCDAETGACVYEAANDGQACGDADGVCEVDAVCQAGRCVPDAEACGCLEDADCADLDDDDLCNGVVRCFAGRCALDPTTVVPCVSDGPCEAAICNPSSGECVVGQLDNGTSCDDNDPCTEGDMCDQGICGGSPVSCEGEAACAEVACHPFAGCRVTTVGGACDDGDGCTEQASCLGGACTALSTVTCTSSGECFDAACNPETGACEETPNTAACDDGQPCTSNDACAGGTCTGQPVVCDDGNPCTTSSCVDGDCIGETASFEGVLCDDGNSCTEGDVCTEGICVGTSYLQKCLCGQDSDCDALDDGDACNGTLVCSDGNCRVDEDSVVSCDDLALTTCQVALCDPISGACTASTAPDGTPCTRTDACAGDGVCQAGVCAVPEADANCDDGNPCTVDSCDPASGCVYANADGPCDDNNPCTDDTTCEDGACTGASSCLCTDDSQCALSGAFDNPCLGTPVCINNSCQPDPATVQVCPESDNPCVAVACNPETGECEETLLDDVPCDDGDACTTGEACDTGVCVAGEAVVCDAEGPCAEGSCDPLTGTCQYVAVDGPCDDGNPCTAGEFCTGGACIPAVNTCFCTADADCVNQIGDLCLGTARCEMADEFSGNCIIEAGTAVSCGQEGDTPCAYEGCLPDTGECEPIVVDEGGACDPTDKCLTNGSCDVDGVCNGEARDCDDDNPCTIDSCDPAIGCINMPVENGTGCDDNDTCTIGDSCQAGVCTSGFNECFCFGGQSDCEAYQPADQCEGQYICDATQSPPRCAKSAPPVCDPTGQEPCVTNTCQSDTGACAISQAPGGTPCDDGDGCTVDDACLAGLGLCAGAQKVCDDGDDCTIDSCSLGQCQASPANDFTPCDDNDPCTIPDVCLSGSCVGSNQCDCNDDDDCSFLGGDFCSGYHRCIEGTCTFDESTVVLCLDENEFDCLDYICDPSTGNCDPSVRPNGESCVDAQGLCTINDECLDSACVGVSVVTCNDDSPGDCIDYACIPESGECGSQVRTNGASCDDVNACTVNDVCVAGGCQGELLTCDDGNPCTEDICSAETGCDSSTRLWYACDDGDPCTAGSVCSHTSLNSSCQGGDNICGCTFDAQCEGFDDGDLCTGVWKCIGGQCSVDLDSIVSCEVDNDSGDAACFEAVCDPETGTCSTVELPSTASCDDSDPCTQFDHCEAGSCVGLTRSCDDGNPCTSDSCDTVSGECVNEVIQNGDACDDGDPCNGADSCLLGECVSGTESGLCVCESDADCGALEVSGEALVVDRCNGGFICTDGQCVLNPVSASACPAEPVGCTAFTCDPLTGDCLATTLPDGSSCNDEDACTSDDRCTAGVCAGSPRNCWDDNPCTIDSCDPDVGCVHGLVSGDCDDGDPCTINDICFGGACVGTASSSHCDDDNPCTKDSCLPSLGCRNLNEVNGKLCDDGDPCSDDDRCDNGLCIGDDPVPSCGCVTDEDCADADGGDACVGQFECVNNHCTLIEGSAVVCPADSTCATWLCNPATGVCDATPVEDGTICNDGDDACTESDQCLNGECVGTPVVCSGSAQPCEEQVCVPKKGCEAQSATGSCNDSTSCTFGDHCAGTQCVGTPHPQPFLGFEDADLSAWTLETTGADAGWQVTSFAPKTGALALHAVNATSGTLTDSAGPWESAISYAPVFVPFGAAEVYVTFKIQADFAADGCEHQEFSVSLNGANVVYEVRSGGGLFQAAEPCASTQGDFLEGRVSLGDTYNNESIELGFRLEVKGSDNSGHGVVIDDVQFQWSCAF